MSNFIQNVPISNNADDLSAKYHENLRDIDWINIAISDFQHDCKCKVQRVNVFFNRLQFIKLVDNKPIVLRVGLSYLVEHQYEEVSDRE